MDARKLAKVQNYRGLISAPFTAFKPNGEINPDILPKYVDYLVKQGVKGVFVNGTTGEGLSLTVEERKIVAEGWVNAGRNKLDLIIMHIGANSIRDAQELARHAEKIGVDAIASIPPIFYRPQNHEHLIAYFKELSSAAPSLPVMLYHFPQMTNVEINLGEFLPKCRQAVPNFCGAKFTSIDVRDLLRCHSLQGEPLKLISGFEDIMLPCLTCGVTATIGANYNYMAPISLRIMEHVQKGNLQEARRLQNIILKIHDTILKYGQGTACLKAVMNLVSPLDMGPPRVPLAPLSRESLTKLKEDLKTLKADQWLNY